MTNARTVPLWDDAHASMGQLKSPDSREVDVLVVGGGIAGLCTALNLARDGRAVTLIEREAIGAGESMRSTAHLASALDDGIVQLRRWHGEKRARAAVQSHAAAIHWIEDFCKAAPGGCGFQRVPGYLFSHDGNVARLREEGRAAGNAGLAVSYLDGGIPGLPQLGPALRFEDQGRLDVAEFLCALARASEELGVKLCRGEVTAIRGGKRPQADVEGFGTIRAKAIVAATNVPFHERVTMHTKQAAYRTYAVAGPLTRESFPDALLWDDGDPYHYVRLTEHLGRQYMIIGGEDHKTGQSADPEAFVRLQAWARDRLGDPQQLTYGWSGQVIEPADGLAFIGRDPSNENVYLITGDSGHGVTHGVLGGLIIADIEGGHASPWTDIYDPSRKMTRAPRDWLRENANVAVQYLDWLDLKTPGLESLQRGHGAVIRKGAHRIAAYRTGDDRLFAFSARCPHLGCLVHWSPQEKSWDCPCHGSRFDARTGRVLNGPANHGLEPMNVEPGVAARKLSA